MDSEFLHDLNNEQYQAVTHEEGPLLIVAGAGTGKTTVITRRIAWLILEKKIQADEILALTFTEKAATEMSERVDVLLPYGYVDLWISTFHSFCERVLREHGLEIGIPNEGKLLNQTEQWLLVKKNLETFDLDYYRPLGNPTKFIHALLKHFSRAKDELVTPEEYLQYAEEMKLNQDSAESTGGKIRKKRKQEDKEILKTPVISSEGVAEVEKSHSGAFRVYDEIPPLASRLGRDDGEKEVEEVDPVKIMEIANAYHTYQQLLLAEGAFDFGDLINYTHELLVKRPGILKRYQKQFKYILVDEFQDTNYAQYEIVKMLSGEAKNITVVGDDDQAIYRFRGASMSNILLFKKDFPGARQILLVKNYRTKQNILDAAYRFIQQNNPNRLEASMGADMSKQLESQRGGVGTCEVLHFADEESEAREMVKRIIEEGSREGAWNQFVILVRSNAQASLFERFLFEANVPYQFMASRGLYTKRVVLDIVSYLKLLDNYHESPALWRVLSMPIWDFSHADLVNLSHAAKKKNHSLFSVFESNISELAWSPASLASRERLLRLLGKSTEEAKRLPVSKVILNFLYDKDSGYLEYLNSDRANELPGEQRARLAEISYLTQFMKKVQSFEATVSDPSVKSFIELMDMEIESGEEGSLSQETESVGPEAVKIMTVHGAKGLEFGTVFIPQLVDKRFPSISRTEPIELPAPLIKDILSKGDFHLEEERRLFYVAMTRAKDRLLVSYADDYGGVQKKKPSRFLFELGMVEKESQKSQPKADQPLAEKVKNRKDAVISSEALAKSRNFIPDGSVSMMRSLDKARDDRVVLPSKFSFTQIKAFSTCPYQYRFAHILKIPVRGNPAFSFGQSLHLALQKFFEKYLKSGNQEQGGLFDYFPLSLRAPTPTSNVAGRGRGNSQGIAEPVLSEAKDLSSYDNKKLPSIDDLLRILDESWIADWYDSARQEEGQKKKAIQILKNIHPEFVQNPPNILFLEKGFNIKVKGPTGKRAYSFTGKIDRIDGVGPNPNDVELIDYKTGSLRELDKEVKKQLLLYQIAAGEVFQLNPVKLTYHYLEENKKESFLGEAKDLENLKSELASIVSQIETSDFPATPSPYVCRYCDFKDICEYRML